MTIFFPEDKVHVAFDGVVVRTRTRADLQVVDVKREDGRVISIRGCYLTVTERSLRPGAFYIDAMNNAYMREHDYWTTFGGTRVEDGQDVPVQPIRRLVPEEGE